MPVAVIEYFSSMRSGKSNTSGLSLASVSSLRHDFLKQCPASNDEGMPELVRAIANGAGRCDAAELNRVMKRTGTKRVRVQQSGRDGYNFWQTVQYTYVLNQKPSYCSAYQDHAWTDLTGSVVYQGDIENGGRWVDVR